MKTLTAKEEEIMGFWLEKHTIVKHVLSLMCLSFGFLCSEDRILPLLIYFNIR